MSLATTTTVRSDQVAESPCAYCQNTANQEKGIAHSHWQQIFEHHRKVF